MGAERGRSSPPRRSPPSFAEGWRMVWKIETLRRIWYSLPFLATALIGFVVARRPALRAGVRPRRAGAWLRRRFGRAGPARRADRRAPVSAPSCCARDPGLVLRLLSTVAGWSSVQRWSSSPWRQRSGVAIVANAVIAGALAVLGPGILAALSLCIPPRARSIGFSVGALWVIPGLVILPIIGAVGDRWGIRWGMLVMVPIFLDRRLRHRLRGQQRHRATSPRSGQPPLRASEAASSAARAVPSCCSSATSRSPTATCRSSRRRLRGGRGQIVALLGTNGAGKSTLLKAISGLVEADHGAVIFDGRDITHAPPERDRRPRHRADARRSRRVPRPDRAGEPPDGRLAPTSTTR